jgi:hypothetical protein
VKDGLKPIQIIDGHINYALNFIIGARKYELSKSKDGMKYLFSVLFILSIFFCKAQSRNLDFFLQQANENSPVVRDYQNQILIAQIDSQLLRASLRTQVNFLNTDSYAPVIRGWGYDPAITNIANLTAIFQANRNFITPNNLAAQL